MPVAGSAGAGGAAPDACLPANGAAGRFKLNREAYGLNGRYTGHSGWRALVVVRRRVERRTVETVVSSASFFWASGFPVTAGVVVVEVGVVVAVVVGLVVIFVVAIVVAFVVAFVVGFVVGFVVDFVLALVVDWTVGFTGSLVVGIVFGWELLGELDRRPGYTYKITN